MAAQRTSLLPRVLLVGLIAAATFAGLTLLKSEGAKAPSDPTAKEIVKRDTPPPPQAPTEPSSAAPVSSNARGPIAPKRGSSSSTPAPASTKAPSTAPTTIKRGPLTWHASWTAARAAAAKAGLPILVYLHMDPIDCPPCRRLDEQVFGVPAAAALQRTCVPIQIEVMRAKSKETQALLALLKPKGFPLLALLSADGGVLHRQVSQLYGSFQGDYSQATPGERLMQLEDLLSITESTAARLTREDKELASLVKRDTPASLRMASRVWAEREQWDKAIAVSRRALSRDPQVAFAHEQMGLIVRAGRTAEAIAGYQSLLAAAPGHALALQWRYQLLKIDPDRTSSADLRALQALISAAVAPENQVLQARTRLLLLKRHGASVKSLADTQLAWFHAHHLAHGGEREATQRLPSDVRWEIANESKLAGRHADAFEHLEHLRFEHPDSAEAQYIKHGLHEQWRSDAQSSDTESTEGAR